MIDLNRGVTKRIHPSGVAVCMYKDDPGVYLDTSARTLSEQMAREAGFPVEQYTKERERRARLAAAFAEINEEFGNIPQGTVVHKVGGYSVVHQGGGEFKVFDVDDNEMTPKGMDKDVAVKLARKMAASEEPDPKDEEEE